MRKYLVGFVCLFIMIVSLALLLAPGSLLWYLASGRTLFVIGRLLAATALLTYSLFPTVRFRFTKELLMGGGMVLIYFGLAGVLPSGMMGLNSFYPMPIDVFLFLLGGVACLLSALELPLVQTTLRNSLIKIFVAWQIFSFPKAKQQLSHRNKVHML